MDVRAVLIPLCVLFTQAPCKPVGSRDAVEALNQTISLAANQTISLALKEIRVARDHLDESLPVVSCSSQNVMERIRLLQEPPSARRLSTVRCMQELSKLTPEVKDRLLTAAQFFKDAEQLLSGNSTGPQSCRLPEFREAPKAYEFAKCLLDVVLEERPNKFNL